MTKTYSTIVEGMTCGNCALTISKILEKKGATHIAANASSGDVSFTIDENASIAKVFDAIDELGYHVVREEKKDTGKKKTDTSSFFLIFCILLTSVLLMHMFTDAAWLSMPWVQFALGTPVFAVGWYKFGVSAFRSVLHRMPNMNVLIMLGSTAAYVYSIIGLLYFSHHAHQYLFFETAASIITLVMLGNWLEHRTTKATTIAIDALLKLQPQNARMVMTDSLGKETVMEIESKFVKTGDVILVNHGDNIPIDGSIISGTAQVDEKMITGESMPVNKSAGDLVVGGTLLLDGNIKVKATTVGVASVLSNIIKMVREAQAVKPPLQKLADKISAVFVPVVLGIALITFFINYAFVHLPFQESIMRSIAVLVISCPCAMGLATPAAIAVGLGRAARNGILIKGADTMEQFKKIKQIVFDKTGTLTTGKLQIQSYELAGISEQEFKSIVASMEMHSSHPIAKSIINEWENNQPANFKDVFEVKGLGMQATDQEGNTWQLGSEKWLHTSNASHKDFDLYLYKNKLFKGALKIEDTIRYDAKQTVARLQEMGYKTILLSGDKQSKCNDLAKQVGIDEVYAEQTPQQKNDVLDKLMAISPVAMVGDGINDAPALAKATIGISLSDSTQIAIQSANVILSNNHLATLPIAIRLGILTEQTIKQNLFWAFFYNVIAIPFAAMGYLSPVWGAGLMGISDIVLILNSLLLKIRKLK